MCNQSLPIRHDIFNTCNFFNGIDLSNAETIARLVECLLLACPEANDCGRVAVSLSDKLGLEPGQNGSLTKPEVVSLWVKSEIMTQSVRLQQVSAVAQFNFLASRLDNLLAQE